MSVKCQDVTVHDRFLLLTLILEWQSCQWPQSWRAAPEKQCQHSSSNSPYFTWTLGPKTMKVEAYNIHGNTLRCQERGQIKTH